jgi:hypothetical protein
MPEVRDDADFWWRRALEARAKADLMPTETAKRAMQIIADRYEVLAECAECIRDSKHARYRVPNAKSGFSWI